MEPAGGRNLGDETKFVMSAKTGLQGLVPGQAEERLDTASEDSGASSSLLELTASLVFWLNTISSASGSKKDQKACT